MSFVRGAIIYKEGNFWDSNPLLRYIKPFDEMYAIDEGGDFSSKSMWCVYFIADPNEDENLFYRIPNKKEMLQQTFHPQVDWEDEVFVKCLEAYPHECLTSIQKALKDKKDWLLKRENFIVGHEYTLENYADLDKMASASKKIWDDFKQIEEDFQVEKGKLIVKGGRNLSKAERGEL